MAGTDVPKRTISTASLRMMTKAPLEATVSSIMRAPSPGLGRRRVRWCVPRLEGLGAHKALLLRGIVGLLARDLRLPAGGVTCQHAGAAEAGGETCPCWMGSVHWQMGQIHTRLEFIGTRGTKHSSNHMRDFAGYTAAGEAEKTA